MQVSPKNLELNAPFTKQSTTTITVSNDSRQSIAFKVKTTAPKLYCVRPNASTIPAGQSMDVSIIFQGLESEPSVGSKCKDKFLIVSVPCKADLDPKTISSIWSDLQENAGKTSDVKLRVVYNFDSLVDPIQEESSQLSTQEPTIIDSTHADAGVVAAGVAGATAVATDDAATSGSSSLPNSKSIENAVRQAAPAVQNSINEKATLLPTQEKEGSKPVATTSEKASSSTAVSAPKSSAGPNIFITAIILALIAFFLSRIIS